MDEVEYWVWLSQRPSCGSVKQHALLDAFGSAREIWEADERALRSVSGLNHEQIDALMQKDLGFARQILFDCERLGVSVLTWEDARYPERLRGIYDPPCVLYVRGTLPDFDNRLCIAVVGTRNCTPYGGGAAAWIAGQLARQGCLIVSGMALGIDGAANRAALEAGGETVAVLGCGVDVCYPSEHKRLMAGIASHGAVLSEYPPGTEPVGKHFPVRNRIITGLCQGTLIVEAPQKSGALISAHAALDQGRDVFAVPGNINRTQSAGVNRLIRNGEAELVTCAAEILEHYADFLETQAEDERHVAKPAPRIAHKSRPQPPQPSVPDGALSDTQRSILDAVRAGADRMDAVIERTGLPSHQVTAEITMLEISGWITRDGSMLYARPVHHK